LKSRLKFFEKVVIKQSREHPELVGKIGVVLGVSSDEDTVYDYQIAFYDDTDSAGFLPSELESTGEFAPRSDFYDDDDDSRIRVSADQDGNGHLVE